MPVRHFIFSKEPAPYTWVTPAKAIWVDSAQITHKREVLPQRTTGVGRGLTYNVLGAKPVNGPVSMKWWRTVVGTIFSTFLRDSASTNVATGVYDHGLLYDDEAAMLALSIQQQYSSTVAINVLGAAVNAATLSAATKEEAKLDFDFLAKDEAKAGGTWDFDGSASPAVIAITNQYPTLSRPLMFYDSAIVFGGTPSLNNTTKKISIAGGSANVKLRNLSIALNHNLDADAYGLVQDPTLQEISPGDRSIEVSFDVSWNDYSLTFYDAARAGTPMALTWGLVGPLIDATYHSEAHVIIPSLYINPFDLPPLDGDNAGKTQSISGVAMVDTVTGKDFNLWLRTSEATL